MLITMSISEAPKDGTVCLIGIEYKVPKPTLVNEFKLVRKKLWASFDRHLNQWVEIGYEGISLNKSCVKWYYPYPFGVK